MQVQGTRWILREGPMRKVRDRGLGSFHSRWSVLCGIVHKMILKTSLKKILSLKKEWSNVVIDSHVNERLLNIRI